MPGGLINIQFNAPKLQKFLNEKRQVLEQSRAAKMKRMQQDFTRISKREREYTHKLLEEIIPIKVSWNEEAWTKLQEFNPLKVEVVRKVEEEDYEGDDESEDERQA
jgi:1-acyl-sn-glycerol-3-phosphate acyltransferase